jgi:DNA-binding NarL/FixJ family response regulator
MHSGHPEGRISLGELAQARKRLQESLGELHLQRNRLKKSLAELRETSVRIRTGNPETPREQSKDGNVLGLLAPREKQVLHLIAEGLSTKEIASQLNISYKTVVCHRTRLLRKAKMHESASLVRLAIRSGLLSA